MPSPQLQRTSGRKLSSAVDVHNEILHNEIRERLEALFQRWLQNLQALLADMGAREHASVLWSSASLGFNPDDTVPGLVHAVTVKFTHLHDMAEEKQRPSAQQAANVLWAFATMGHPAATAQVVGAICFHIGRLTQHPDAEQRPNAQACANVLVALTRLGLSLAVIAAEVVDLVCLHFAHLTRHPDAKQRPAAQGCSTSFGLLQKWLHSVEATDMVDSICLHFAHLTGSPIAKQRPTTQALPAWCGLWAL